MTYTAKEIIDRIESNRKISVEAIGKALMKMFEENIEILFNSTDYSHWNSLTATTTHNAEINRADIKAYVNPLLLPYGLHASDITLTLDKASSKFGFNMGNYYSMTVKPLSPSKD